MDERFINFHFSRGALVLTAMALLEAEDVHSALKAGRGTLLLFS